MTVASAPTLGRWGSRRDCPPCEGVDPGADVPAALLERVLAGSFRADRYGSLLAGELLPKTSPFSDYLRSRIWRELRQAQREYQEAVETRAFSAERNRAIAAGASPSPSGHSMAVGPLPGCGRSR